MTHKSKMFHKILLISFLIINACFSTYAQNTYVLTGIVLDAETNSPIPFVTVQIENSELYSIGDGSGFFKFKKFPLKETTLKATSLGYITKEITISKEKHSKVVVIKMQQANLSVNEVVVTAKRLDSKEGTSSTHIGTEAIKQVQTFSLSDIVSLLPGNKVTVPDLTSSQQIQLRSAEDGGSSVNSFGTSVLIDGIPINNDANMQALNPASSTAGVKSTANSGVDLRNIPTSNIESVEVITGVPSAKY